MQPDRIPRQTCRAAFREVDPARPGAAASVSARGPVMTFPFFLGIYAVREGDRMVPPIALRGLDPEGKLGESGGLCPESHQPLRWGRKTGSAASVEDWWMAFCQSPFPTFQMAPNLAGCPHRNNRVYLKCQPRLNSEVVRSGGLIRFTLSR